MGNPILTHSVFIEGSKEDIFRLMNDFEKIARYFAYNLKIEYLSSKKQGLNTKIKWYGRKIIGRWHSEEITEYTENDTLQITYAQSQDQPTSDSTMTHNEVVTYKIQSITSNSSILTGTMELLMSPVTKEEIQRHFGMLRNYLTTIKRVVEGRGEQSVSGIIKAPVQDTFAYLVDLEGICEHSDGCVKVEIISPQKTGVGVKSLWYTTKNPTQPRLEEIVEYEVDSRISYLNYGLTQKIPRVKGILDMKSTDEGWTHFTFTEIYFWEKPKDQWEPTKGRMLAQIRTMQERLKKS
jgi:hypothetical protein